jgi:hypothetical protein
MLETQEEIHPPRLLQPGPDGRVHLLEGRPPGPLTPEQVERMRKTDDFFADNQRLWDQMSPEQQAAEDAAWERVMREINAARPHRPVFVDQ